MGLKLRILRYSGSNRSPDIFEVGNSDYEGLLVSVPARFFGFLKKPPIFTLPTNDVPILSRATEFSLSPFLDPEIFPETRLIAAFYQV